MFNFENPMAWVVGGGDRGRRASRGGEQALKPRAAVAVVHGGVVSRRHGPSVRLAVDIKEGEEGTV